MAINFEDEVIKFEQKGKFKTVASNLAPSRLGFKNHKSKFYLACKPEIYQIYPPRRSE
ncbi:hypothetical protein H7R39_01460 [Campylobacter sp. Marseille-Q3452]|uniref:Uncharacterized protein n=1 Tax=Campylobacter massiliensis TaxID=2762557 RepID=A0A842J2G1_9BACT|nr:hypothetical protein [Campylobacter massiliensis]MBC2881957.1 hypothetical protein [Campylobacter massiliensis]